MLSITEGYCDRCVCRAVEWTRVARSPAPIRSLDHRSPGSLAPHFGDHGPSDSALAAASGWRLRRPAAERHATRDASRALCSGARPSAPCALEGFYLLRENISLHPV